MHCIGCCQSCLWLSGWGDSVSSRRAQRSSCSPCAAICGDARHEGEQEKNLVNNINNLKISDKVHLLGFQENVYKFLKKADCFILSSLWEDPGFVLLEAAVSNTTIISSDCPNGPAEILGNEGFLFKNNSLQDLIEKFNEYKSTKKEIIYKNKILIKKRVKMFTQFQHFQSLKKLII